MVKIQRALLVLAGLCFASGQDTASCALNGAEAVDEMLDSAVYIMASLVRCTKGHKDTNEIACALDVSSAIESVNGMINVIMKAVDNCGALKQDHHKCGLAVGVLTRSFAGLSAASAGIVAKCPNKLNGFKAIDTVGGDMEDAAKYGGKHPFKTAGKSSGFGQCIINVKDTIKSLFKAIKRVMTIKENCADPASLHCKHNTIKIVSSFTALGEYLAGAIGKCDVNTSADAECAQMSLRLVRQTENVGRASVAMVGECDIGAAERLYLEDAEDSMTPATSNKATVALAALLPITAVVAFVGGSRFAKARAQSTEDSELLVEGQVE